MSVEVILDSLVENRDYQKLLKCLKSHGYGVQIQTFGLKVLARLLEKGVLIKSLLPRSNCVYTNILYIFLSKDYHASNKMVVDNDLEIISIPWRELSDYPKIENSVLEVLTALGKTSEMSTLSNYNARILCSTICYHSIGYIGILVCIPKYCVAHIRQGPCNCVINLMPQPMLALLIEPGLGDLSPHMCGPPMYYM